MEKQFKNCQSCGMPLARDEHGGGTEADGIKQAAEDIISAAFSIMWRIKLVSIKPNFYTC